VLLSLGLALVACGDISPDVPSSRRCATEEQPEGDGGELDRAATFAIRAGGSTGFLDEGPTFRDYVGIRSDDDGFIAIFEAQLEVRVVLDGGTWVVVSAEGEIDEESCLTLLGYSEPDSEESPGHEFLKTRLSAADPRRALRARLFGAPVWLGPIPYEGFRSRCYAQLYDEDGEATHKTRYYPIDIPEKETDRSSGVTFIQVADDPTSATGEFICETVASVTR
jgi:hypothetical protein